jgi:probable F420-dependent oxidoreductase
MRFHQAVAFLETDQLLELCRACDEMGYAGMYVSDHLFYPRELRSRYTYSPHADGSPIWPPETEWPDPWCLISAMAAVTTRLHFTTGVYIAPARDLITVAKLVATAAAISRGRVHLGLGAGWCAEEFAAIGQPFEGRGRRLDDMIPALRALWAGGWVSYHGSHYEVPEMQMNPSPPGPVPIYGGGHSAPALRRAAQLCDGWLAASAYQPDDAIRYLGLLKEQLKAAGRLGRPYTIYLALAARPDVDLYRRFEDEGVTDMICAPWMLKPSGDGRSDAASKIAAAEAFATDIVARMTEPDELARSR